MSDANDMAFPALDRSQTPNATVQLGLTKREYFALHLMAAGIAADGENRVNYFEDRANDAVTAADALLERLSVG